MDKEQLEKLKALSQVRTKVVIVERWGNMPVTIRELSNKEVRELQEEIKDETGGDMKRLDQTRAGKRMLAKAIMEPEFSLEDIEVLTSDEMAAAPIIFLSAEVQRLNNLTEQGVKDAESTFPDTEKQGRLNGARPRAAARV